MNDHPNTAHAMPYPPTVQAPDSPDCVRAQPDMYFRDGGFHRDVEAHAAISTGYADLDRVRPLSPGLYCLGKCPGTDATDFCSQMTDQVAASDQSILYFSLRHTAFSLHRRSLARVSCREEEIRPTPPDTTSGGTGRTSGSTDQADSQAARNLHVIHDNVPMTVEDITGMIDDFIGWSGAKPLVIIDCLPLVAPSPELQIPLDPKTVADRITRSLKTTQAGWNLAMILVVPLEDCNYPDPIDIDSFEGHGDLEYLADVLWGLQPSEPATEDMRDTARRVVLTCVKDRYYAPDYSVAFLHHADSCFFRSEHDPESPET